MPEGDSVFRFAASVRSALEGREITAARAHGPGPVPRVEKLVGTVCNGVRTHGKNLFILFANGLALRGHLRMYGLWRVLPAGAPLRFREEDVRLVLETSESTVVNLRGPVLELLEQRALAFHTPAVALGPDLLAGSFDGAEVLRRYRRPDRMAMTLGDAVMDQSAMAGVGNIWKHETLFRCGLNPWLKVSDLSDEALRGLIATARELLRASAGLPDAAGAKARRPSYFVYMRAGRPCRRCLTRLRSRRQGRDIRFTTWCPRCQPGPDGPGPPAGTESVRGR